MDDPRGAVCNPLCPSALTAPHWQVCVFLPLHRLSSSSESMFRPVWPHACTCTCTCVLQLISHGRIPSSVCMCVRMLELLSLPQQACFSQQSRELGLRMQGSFSIQFSTSHFKVHVFLIVMNTMLKLIVLWLVYYI